MADSRPFALANQIDIEQLLVEAQQGWLRLAEICEILRNHQKFHFASQPPNRPPSGSFFLFDRKVVTYFSKDGHNWRRKNDGRTVEEAHQWLKVGGIDVLHCYNAHGEENENFQRHSYWILEKEFSHIVLVHYREVKTSKIGSSHLSNWLSNQKKYSDLVHDATSRSHEQEVGGDDLLNSLGPSFTHPNRLPYSEVREFEYRANHVQDVVASSIGSIGLASYLEEMDLRSLLSAINLNKAHNAAKIAARIRQTLQVLSFQLKEYGDDTFGISDESALWLEVEIHKPRQLDELAHAAAIRIQSKFHSWKCRKDFLIILQQIVIIQVHVRGHQVGKSYKNIVWSLRSLDKAITKGGSSMEDISSKDDEFKFLKEGGKQLEERLQKPLFQLTSMVQYPETRDQYQFNGNTLELQTDNYQGMLSVVPRLDFISPSQADKSRVVTEAGFTDEPMIAFDSQSGEYMDVDNFSQGVGSQPLHPLSSSSQPYTPKQGHKILGQLSSNIFGEQEQSGGHLPIHAESQIFESKEALIQWTRDVGKKNGFVILTKRSDSGDGGQKARITFGCERGGQYRNTDKNKGDKKEKQLRNINTTKCG